MAKVYSDLLDDLFNDYQGEYDYLLIKIPVYFKILQKIYSKEDLNWQLKFKINACFSYFAVPTDVISDEIGPKGYLDDLFVCVYVLNSFIPDHQDLLIKYFDSENLELKELEETLDFLIYLLKEKTIEILNFTGLSKFNDLSNELTFLEVPRNINEKLRRIQLENLELFALLQTLTKQLQENHIRIHEYSNLGKIKELFSKEEWKDVETIVEQVKIYEKGFDNEEILSKDKFNSDVQEELNKIKSNISFEIDKLLLEGLE